MTDYRAKLFPGGYYHIFNKAVGKEKLFMEADNYRYFFQRFSDYISPISDLFCYCLLPNHFHFFLRIKEEDAVIRRMEILNRSGSDDNDMVPDFLLQQFSNCFNAYTKALNKQQTRKGKLFIEPFNRRLVTDAGYYTKLIYYIHTNPMHHGFCNTVDKWPFTSYHQILNREVNWLQHEEIINWFGSNEEYFKFHQQPVKRK
jgi:putative transposase